MAHTTSGTNPRTTGAVTSARLPLSLAAALLIAALPACAGSDPEGGGSASATAGATEPAAGDATTTGAPQDASATADVSTTSDAGASTSSATSTTHDPGGDLPEPTDACVFDEPDLPIDCAAIARIVPTGVGVSEAHVVRRHLRLEDAAGEPLGAAYRDCLVVTDGACEPLPLALEPAPSRSITALLVRPGADPAANAALAGALDAFLDSRPADEAIGIFRWGAAVTQIATPTVDRARLHRLVASGLQPLEGAALPIADAVATVAGPLAALQQGSHHSRRQLLVVAPGHPDVDPAALALDGDAAPLRVEWIADDAIEAALLDESAHLDAALAAGELVLRHCGGDGHLGLQLRTAGGGPSLALPTVQIPGAEQVQVPFACDPVDHDLAPALPGVIDIDFSPMERLEYEARRDEQSKEPFYGALRTDLNAPGVRARVKLKLHGQGSLDCERKSLTVNLTDDRPRQWLAGSGTDQFVLVSMCKDDRYITQTTANLLMAELGLFAPRFRMVELIVGGESQGAYLLVERPQTLLRRDTLRTRAVVRRASDIEGDDPDLEYPDDDEPQPLAAYEALIGQAEALKGDALIAWLEASMDLEQYLRWIALMSLLRSGDFIDEVYFVSTEVTGPDAGPRDYFTISTWDQDDIFSNCHKGGINAIVDPHGLLHCAESRLDHAIFKDAEIYDRFVAALAETIARIDQAAFDAACQASEAQVLEILARDPARAAMVELLDDNPKAVDYEVAKEEVLERGAALRAEFQERRALLVELIAAYGG